MAKNDDIEWAVVEDDGANFWSERASVFLQGFLPPESDTVWSDALFRWKLGSGNPAGSGYLSLAVANDRVIATTSITSKRLWIDGQIVIGGEIGDTYTDAQFRKAGHPAVLSTTDPDPHAYVNKSVFGRLVQETRRRAEAAGKHFIYGTPNQNSMPGYTTRLDFLHFDVMRYESLVRLRALGLVQRKPVLRPILVLLEGLDKLSFELMTITTKISSAGSNTKIGFPAEEDLDQLWERLKPDYNFTLVRDEAWFRFRYINHPNATYDFVSLFDHRKLEGFMVFRRHHDMAGNLVLTVADWLIDQQNKAGFARLLLEGIQQFSKNVQSVHLWTKHGSPLTASLSRYGFLRRGEIPIIFANTKETNSMYEKKHPFDISIGASDNV